MSVNDTIGSESVVASPSDAGKNGRDVGEVASFKNPAKPSGSSSAGGSASMREKEKKKVGRPTKNLSGLSAEKIDQILDDPETEAAREEFENSLVFLLVTTTDNIADARFEILKTKYPETAAKALADKARLTEKEKKYFGGMAIQLWRKYVGDKYLFTPEATLAIYFVNYMMRNWEPMSAARKIEKEANGDNKQPGLQKPERTNTGSEANGKIDPGVPLDPLPSGTARARV